MKLGPIGVLATFTYFICIGIFAGAKLLNLGNLDLNELGDFLAGVFGPPALIWVVISFYLQSKELSNSVAALELQSKELRESVEQQRELVKSNEAYSQFEMDRYIGDMKLEALKLSSDIKRDINRLPVLLDQANVSRLALFALNGMTKSGAAEIWKNEFESMQAASAKINDLHEAIDTPELPTDRAKLTDIVAKYYHLRNSGGLLRTTLEGTIRDDNNQRENILKRTAK